MNSVGNINKPSRYKRAGNNLLADEKGPNRGIQVWFYIYLINFFDRQKGGEINILSLCSVVVKLGVEFIISLLSFYCIEGSEGFNKYIYNLLNY